MREEDRAFSLTQNFRRRIQRASTVSEKAHTGDNYPAVDDSKTGVSSSSDYFNFDKKVTSSALELFGLFAATSLKYGLYHNQTHKALMELTMVLGFELVAFYAYDDDQHINFSWKLGNLNSGNEETHLPEKLHRR